VWRSLSTDRNSSTVCGRSMKKESTTYSSLFQDPSNHGATCLAAGTRIHSPTRPAGWVRLRV
jgi:hypothetical protein